MKDAIAKTQSAKRSTVSASNQASLAHQHASVKIARMIFILTLTRNLILKYDGANLSSSKRHNVMSLCLKLINILLNTDR